MALAQPASPGWTLSIEPVGDVATLLPRLLATAQGTPVALGVDFPIGLPRAYAALHPAGATSFPAFLHALRARPSFFDVAESLEQITPGRPFYPRRGRAGMTRLSHATALGLQTAAGLSRACDQATTLRPAGAPLFWTLGANQTGKAAISAWRDLLLPALAAPAPRPSGPSKARSETSSAPATSPSPKPTPPKPSASSASAPSAANAASPTASPPSPASAPP